MGKINPREEEEFAHLGPEGWLKDKMKRPGETNRVGGSHRVRSSGGLGLVRETCAATAEASISTGTLEGAWGAGGPL